MSHAFGSATHLSEVATSTIRWVTDLLGPETGARVLLPDRTGRLRTAAAGGDGAAVGRKRSARRRAAYEEKQPVVRPLRRPSERALAILPLVSRGRAVGVLEVVAPQPVIDRRWRTLEAVASQSAIAVRNLRERIGLERQVQALGAAAALVREVVRAPSLEEAARSTMRLCFELLRAPMAAWTSNGDPRHLTFLGVRGLGRTKREGVRRALPSLPRWEDAPAARRRELATRFAEIAEGEDVAAIDGDDAVILVAADLTYSQASLEVVGSLFREVLVRLTAMARAERRSERLDLGLAWTAHEVRGPLLAAKAAIDSLLETNGDGVPGRELLSRSHQELSHLAGLVEPVLRWAVGGGALHRRPADLVRLVREVVASCALEAGVDRVNLTVPGDELSVRADVPQLRGALANVIRNALAYSPGDAPVDVSVEPQDGVATVAVRDRGPGISAEERESIFDPLARGQVGQSTRAGNGLGLFIARRVLDAHGGRIWLEPTRRGCVFRVELPLSGSALDARPHRR